MQDVLGFSVCFLENSFEVTSCVIFFYVFSPLLLQCSDSICFISPKPASKNCKPATFYSLFSLS